VIDGPLPHKLFAEQPKKGVVHLEKSCVFAKIESFHYTQDIMAAPLVTSSEITALTATTPALSTNAHGALVMASPPHPTTPSLSNVHNSFCIPTVTLEIPGPIVQRYTVVDGPLPRELFAAQPKISVIYLEETCTFAKIEAFHDVHWMRFLSTQTWIRLRVLEPNLLP
jgi:hypothetical protein